MSPPVPTRGRLTSPMSSDDEGRSSGRATKAKRDQAPPLAVFARWVPIAQLVANISSEHLQTAGAADCMRMSCL